MVNLNTIPSIPLRVSPENDTANDAGANISAASLANNSASSSSTSSTVKYQDSGLKNLFFVHHLMGISYFGASVPSKPLSLFIKILLISWNIAACAFSYYTFHISTAEAAHQQQTQIAESSNSSATISSFLGQKALAPLVNYIRYWSLLVYFCFSYLLNLYMGLVARCLIRLLKKDIFPLLDAEVEHRIGTRIALVQMAIITGLTISFQALLYLKFGCIQWARWLENILNLYSLSTPVTTIAYINLTLSHIIITTASANDLSLYITRLTHLRAVVTRLTCLLSYAIALVIFNATIVCIASLCLLVADFTSTFFISVIGFIDYSALLVLLVYFSSYAYETTYEMNAKFKVELYLAAACKDDDDGDNPPQPISSRLITLASLLEDMQMCPFGLFHLSRSYILTFFAFMLSYSVIMIQTSESSAK